MVKGRGKYVRQFPIRINPMHYKDAYKEYHKICLPEEMEYSTSYFTPRKSRVKEWKNVVVHGYQALIKQRLIDDWNENFFYRDCDEVVEEYARTIDNTMRTCDRERVKKLWELGYLPIEIYALPEGTLCPMHVPFFCIRNTHPEFAWLPQALESMISNELWKPMVTATVGHTYREIVNYWYNRTCEDTASRAGALGNFDMRGDAGYSDALFCASGWLLSFVNTATVMATPYMEAMYNCDCTKEVVGRGANSTEHFVMCSNSAIDTVNNPDETYEYKDIDPRRERVFLKRLLTEISPNESVSAVCDSYDYRNVVTEIIPTLREEILNHNTLDGKPCTLLIRGDSGDPVEIVTWTVREAWKYELPGNRINSKGYKELDPHIKIIYGDSIQIKTAEKIYKILESEGFAASNVSLGVGSFSMHCIIEEEEVDFNPSSSMGKFLKRLFPGAFKGVMGIFKPHTRDTFSSAIKAQNAIIGGVELAIYKDPKTDRETGAGFKKSAKGCCRVFKGINGKLTYMDNLTFEESLNDNLLVPVFRDGKLLVDQSLSEIRARLNDNKF